MERLSDQNQSKKEKKIKWKKKSDEKIKNNQKVKKLIPKIMKNEIRDIWGNDDKQ
jgi:hypothetical protein